MSRWRYLARTEDPLTSSRVTSDRGTQELIKPAPEADESPPATGRRPRGSYSKGRAKRAEILREAVHVFAESGFRGGSLKHIADRVGLSQAGLLHHFSSKEQLLAEVIDERDEMDEAHLLVDGELPTGWTALQRIADLVRHNATVPGLVQLYTTLSSEAIAEDHPAHGVFVDRYRWLRSFFDQAISKAQADGDVDAGLDPTATGSALIALLDGLQIQWLLEPTAVDMATAYETALDRLRPRRPAPAR